MSPSRSNSSSAFRADRAEIQAAAANSLETIIGAPLGVNLSRAPRHCR